MLPASQVVRFIVPRYVQDDPSLAGVLNESTADRCGEKLSGKKVRDVLPDHLVDVPRPTPTTRSSKWPRSWRGCAARSSR
ncbi:hypothetical protein I550_3592 [Mycobacterium intracellulare 1956]|uniref:Uncharacterized protein n=1 Tax=Mycobacterium intracellulare 1956 TaxID=1299331 RepID=X8CGD2_MYCIT|nr:hypothetical protein I550_3592 [Mycobacterium intracellulare 1956]